MSISSLSSICEFLTSNLEFEESFLRGTLIAWLSLVHAFCGLSPRSNSPTFHSRCVSEMTSQSSFFILSNDCAPVVPRYCCSNCDSLVLRHVNSGVDMIESYLFEVCYRVLLFTMGVKVSPSPTLPIDSRYWRSASASSFCRLRSSTCLEACGLWKRYSRISDSPAVSGLDTTLRSMSSRPSLFPLAFESKLSGCLLTCYSLSR